MHDVLCAITERPRSLIRVMRSRIGVEALFIDSDADGLTKGTQTPEQASGASVWPGTHCANWILCEEGPS